MVFSLACYKHAKGFGKCALLEVLQAFKIKKVVFPTWQTFGASPDDACPAALAKTNVSKVLETRGEKRYSLKHIVSRKL